MYQSEIPGLKLLFRGKVRDVYDLGQELLIVTTDRISAFDVVLPDPIPGKGRVLNLLTRFWLEKFKDMLPTHASDRSLKDIIKDPARYEELKDRAVVVKKTRPLPVECVVRGYRLGTGYTDYLKTGAVCGIKLPAGMQEAAKLPQAIFTPSSKAEIGRHDENITFAEVADKIGRPLAERVRDISVKLYAEGSKYAETKGILIADTKFEFGLLGDELLLIDEVLTPDSSRFWPKSSYQVGMSPPSFDKQFVRDHLKSTGWNKTPPAPHLPPEVIRKTAEKYEEALRVLAGASLGAPDRK
jgi:phosphoribosylaminoimidazole-succinocarboxamide synthase